MKPNRTYDATCATPWLGGSFSESGEPLKMGSIPRYVHATNFPDPIRINAESDSSH